MKKIIICIFCILSSILSFSNDNYYLASDTIKNSKEISLVNEKSITAQNDSAIQSERIFKLIIEENLLIENRVLNGSIITLGNIDNYKNELSNSLLEDGNVISIHNKAGVSFSKRAFNNKFGFSLGFYERMEVDFSFSKDLFDLVFFGNEMFLGDQIDLSNTSLSATKFEQLRFSLSRIIKLNGDSKYIPDKIEFDLGLSYLIGNHHIDFSTNQSYIELGEEGEYINTNLNFSANFADSSEFNSSQLFKQLGSGYSIDLFININKETHNLIFFIDDLGLINWNKYGTNYTSEKNINFSGLEINNLLNINDSLIQNQLDSLSDIELVSESKKITTYLPTTYHISYKKDLAINYIDYITLGRISKHRGGNIPLHYKPKYYIGTNIVHKGLYLKTNYSIGGYSTTGWQIEIGQDAFWKHFKIVLGTHHFESIFKGINSSNANVYFKLNFMFGKKIPK